MPGGDLVLAKQPGPGGGSGGGPAQSIDEIFFWARVVRGSDLDTEAEEVAALDAGRWNPSSVDFRAISIRSAGGRNPRSDAEISTTREFLNMLAQPARRFNFFAYSIGTDELTFQAETRAGALAGESDSGPGQPGSPALGRPSIAALRELGSLQLEEGIWVRPCAQSGKPPRIFRIETWQGTAAVAGVGE